MRSGEEWGMKSGKSDKEIKKTYESPKTCKKNPF